MITQEQIPKVLGHPVYDRQGAKIGEAKHVFVDDVTGKPDWVSVRTGLFGMSESFVPIREASLIQDHLEVPYDNTTVKEAPKANIDAGGHLSAQEERRLYRHYGISWGAASGTAQEKDAGGTAGTGAYGDERAGAGGTGAYGDERAGAGGTGAYGDERAGAGRAGQAGDDAMTRSEEEMRVGVERHEAGRARLHKYVVTEQVEKTVPVRREKARIVREPITDDNRERAMRGPDISEAEEEVTLYEERAVVETETVPKERVRLETEEVTDQETVSGEVRKERIEHETPDEPDRPQR